MLFDVDGFIGTLAGCSNEKGPLDWVLDFYKLTDTTPP